MKQWILAVALCAVSVALSGCLATAATVGASLATGIAAGCENAALARSANRDTVNSVCGSWFK